jgi:ion channel-forming bestrophin family protein
MLDYGRPKSWLRLVFSIRGSALVRIRYRLLAVGTISLLLTFLHEIDHIHTPLTLQSLSLMGLALGIFLGFRNNTSYDRFWEGRRLWGTLVNVSRTLTRDLLTVLPPAADGTPTAVQRRQVYRLIAFVHALRMALREQTDVKSLDPLLDASDTLVLCDHSNLPNAILLRMAAEHRALAGSGELNDYWSVLLAERLAALTDVQGGCERIKNTPMPHSYSILIHSIVALYVFALPFGLVGSLHYFTPLVVLMVAYTFLGLDTVGDELEDPFGEDLNDLPLSTISRTIEINLRQMLGEADVPPPYAPVNGYYA